MKRIPMWRRYDRLFGADSASDVREELRFHIDAKIDDLVARGWKPEAARLEAELQSGDRSQSSRPANAWEEGWNTASTWFP